MNTVECTAGVFDCAYVDGAAGCAPYNNAYPTPDTMDWTMGLSVVFAVLMAFGIGANDAANAWATSVGSKAITLTRAVMIGGFFEFLGALTLGYGVSKKIQTGVASIDDADCWACGYCDSKMSVFEGGMFAALAGASVFLMSASHTSVPVSTTHSIVGGVIGMTITGTHFDCLNWAVKKGLGGIMLSWLISPLLSGVVASSLYRLSEKYVMGAQNPVKVALRVVSFLFFLSTVIMVNVIFWKSKPLKKNVPKELSVLISCIIGVAVSVLTEIFIAPRIKANLPSQRAQKRLQAEIDEANNVVVELAAKKDSSASIVAVDMASDDAEKAAVDPEKTKGKEESTESSADEEQSTGVEKVKYEVSTKVQTKDQKDAIYVFRWLLLFNACLESYAHGANDTANATGAFNAVWHSWKHGIANCDLETTPWWIMAIAGLTVWLGVATYGKNVINTIGTKVTSLDFHKGFYIEFGSNFSVVIATLLKLPVSTTHCQIGGVLFVGLVSSGRKGVDWSLMGTIIMSWVLTLPIAGGFAALVTAVIRATL